MMLTRSYAFGALAALIWLAAWPVAAQEPAPTDDRESTVRATWSIGAGYGSTTLRDIARTARPMDASPISLVAQGPVLTARHDRASKTRLHRFEVGLSRAATFSYRSPLRTETTASDEQLTGVRGQYEYRRYPLRDTLAKGLDFGIGVQGSVDRLVWQRVIPVAIGIRESRVVGGVGIVAAARLHRWHRFDVEASWVNAALLARTSQRHTAGTISWSSSGGGGWLTGLRIMSDVRLAARTSLAVSYARDDGGVLASHYSIATNGRRLVVGVTHGR